MVEDQTWSTGASMIELVKTVAMTCFSRSRTHFVLIRPARADGCGRKPDGTGGSRRGAMGTVAPETIRLPEAGPPGSWNVPAVSAIVGLKPVSGRSYAR